VVQEWLKVQPEACYADGIREVLDRRISSLVFLGVLRKRKSKITYHFHRAYSSATNSGHIAGLISIKLGMVDLQEIFFPNHSDFNSI
jgi:hypothetical protein